MKKFLLFHLILCLCLLVFAPQALAQTVQVVGKITNINTQTQGSTIQFVDPSTHDIVGMTTVNPDGSYFISVPKGTYDVTIIPPVQSGLLPTTSHQQITDNSVTNLSVSTSPDYLRGKQYSPINLTFVLGIVTIVIGLVIGYLFWKRR